MEATREQNEKKKRDDSGRVKAERGRGERQMWMGRGEAGREGWDEAGGNYESRKVRKRKDTSVVKGRGIKRRKASLEKNDDKRGRGSWRIEMEKEMRRGGVKAKGDNEVRIWLTLSST